MLVIKNEQGDSLTVSNYVDEAISKLKIDLGMSSNPEIIKEILEEEMLLSDCDGFQSRFGAQLKSPQPLTPILEKIRSGIMANHPAIVEFLCAAIRENLIHDNENSSNYVKRIIHYIYLLDLLTTEMFNNWEFMVEVRQHFLNKREQLGIDSNLIRSFFDILKITGGLFFSAKTVTMDWVFQEYERIRRQGFIDKEDVVKRKAGLTLNILEAVITDKRKGFRNNALTGLTLIVTPPEDVILTQEKRTLEYLLSPQWTRLYQTWNLAFISGNMDNLDLLYPKLLIPSVLNASAPEYLFNCALSLWAAINFYLFRKANGQSDTLLPLSSEIAQVWGEINFKYAQQYIRKDKDFFLSRLNEIADSNEPQVKNMIEEISSDLLKK